MEKTVSPEERIKRAEEIYSRRKTNNNSVRVSSTQVKDGQEKRRLSLYKKMILQILICILIYLIFSLIKEANYLFSETVLNKTREFLSQDINFEVVSSQVGQFFQDNQGKFNFLSNWLKDDNEQENQNTEEQNTQNIIQNETNNQENNTIQNEQNNTTNSEQVNNTEVSNNTNNTVGIGGATSNEVTVATSSSSSSAEKTQMQLDAEYIKKNFKLQLPVKGNVTSGYGKRKATEIVSENHQGIDIGVNVGTKIVAAMEGKVTLVSNEGEYGTHVKIENKDIVTIYAHCSKILVKEGATVKKGQKIALSGNTGKTTGPHLHFEIRRGTRTVDPELVLSW